MSSRRLMYRTTRYASCHRWVGLIALAMLFATGCQSTPTTRVDVVDLEAVPVEPVAAPVVELAGGEVVGIGLRITGPAAAVRLATGAPADSTSAYEVLFATSDRRIPAITRRTGRYDGIVDVPKALRQLDATGDTWLLPTVRPVTVWLDVRLHDGLAAGTLPLTIEVLAADGRVVSSAEVSCRLRGIDLRDRSSLLVAGAVDHDELARGWPVEFTGVTPQSISRTDSARNEVVAVLDAMQARAAEAGLGVYFPDLGPRVSSRLSRDMSIDWRDYVDLVRPWFLRPDAVAWLPATSVERLQEWEMLADGFRREGWLPRTTAVLRHEQVAPRLDRGSPVAVRAMSELARLLSLQLPRVIAEMPCDDVAPSTNAVLPSAPERIERSRASRPGPSTHLSLSAAEVPRDLGWLAIDRRASAVLVDQVTAVSADDDHAWFYPGAAFGVEEPVVLGIAAMAARRAAQDHALLSAVADVAGKEAALALASAVARPIVVPVALRDVPSLDLLAGTSDPVTLYAARRLAASAVSVGSVVVPTPDIRPILSRVRWDLRMGPTFAGDVVDRRRLSVRVEAAARMAVEPEPEGFAATFAGLSAGWSPAPPTPPTSAPDPGGVFTVAVGANTAPSDAPSGSGPDRNGDRLARGFDESTRSFCACGNVLFIR